MPRLREPEMGRVRVTFRPPTPPPADLDTTVAAVHDALVRAGAGRVVAYWRIDPSVGGGLADQMGNHALQWARGVGLAGQPRIVENDTGQSMLLGLGDGDRLRAGHHPDWNSAALTVVLHYLAMQTESQIVWLSREAGTAAGSLGLETHAGGAGAGLPPRGRRYGASVLQ